MARASEPQPIPQSLPDSPTDALTAALATLGHLRAENLITEEEYQAKRKAHLDRLFGETK